MRVIERPDLQSLSAIGTVKRLEKLIEKIKATLRRNLTAEHKLNVIAKELEFDSQIVDFGKNK